MITPHPSRLQRPTFPSRGRLCGRLIIAPTNSVDDAFSLSMAGRRAPQGGFSCRFAAIHLLAGPYKDFFFRLLEEYGLHTLQALQATHTGIPAQRKCAPGGVWGERPDRRRWRSKEGERVAAVGKKQACFVKRSFCRAPQQAGIC